MTIIEAIILGIVQGITEFLPISSSGHIELGKVFMEVRQNADFTILLHAATVLSILIVFRKDIGELITGLFKSEQRHKSWHYVGLLALSAIPVALIGIALNDYIDAFFEGNLLLVGCCLLLTAGILLLTKLDKGQNREVGIKSAVIIGLAQVVAILPGVSRSGTTIATALALGINKEAATRFSFLMILAPIIGASLLELKDLGEMSSQLPTSNLAYLAGFTASFITGLVACTLMLNIVKQGKIIYFSAYCLVVGVIAIALSTYT